jgi:hypothetical protein
VTVWSTHSSAALGSAALDSVGLTGVAARALATLPTDQLTARAREIRDASFGTRLTF